MPADAAAARTLGVALGSAPRLAAHWSLDRLLGPSSLTGASLSLGICAAAWFTAGTRSGNLAGALALVGGYLAAVLAGRPARMLSAGAGAVAGGAGAVAGVRKARWRARVGGCLGELVVCAGLAIGGRAEGWDDVWELAIAVLAMLAVRQMMAACGAGHDGTGCDGVRPGRAAARGAGAGAEGNVQGQRAGLAVRALTGVPPGGRVLLVAVVAPVWGARATLLAMLAWLVIGIGFAVTGPGPLGGGVAAARTTAALAARRDDGPAALWLGSLVRGNLVPLPPALLGLAATAMLAILGMGNLPGVLVLTPLVVLMLAAPGSSHPHDGRLDWLVPGTLLACQLLYIATLGVCTGVPRPAVFALCGLVTLRYTIVAGPILRRRGLGWEGRMLAVGIGAWLGIPTVAYIALTAYLGVLICLEIMTSHRVAAEGGRR